MRSLPKQPSETYHIHVVSQGMKFAFAPSLGELQFAVGYGAGMHPEADLDARYDPASDRVSADQNGHAYLVRIPLFNPTWAGIAAWMKYGFYGPSADAPTAPGSPTPAPSPNAMRTIAEVVAVSPGAYQIDDGGAATCKNGDAGHKILLRALTDPETHPLTSVVVDVRSMRFCTMDFRLGASSALSFTGFFELNWGTVGSAWQVTDGTADFLIRALGFAAKRTHMVFDYSNVVAQS